MSKPSSGGGASEAPLSTNPLRIKGFNPLGSITLILGRSVDPILQYNLLRHGYAGVILENVFRAKRIINLPLVNKITFPGVGLGLAGVGARDYWGANMVDKPGNLLVTMTGIFALRQVSVAAITCHDRLDSLSIFSLPPSLSLPRSLPRIGRVYVRNTES